MWHDGLIYKINRIGITGNSLNLIESFLSNRFQRVVLNGQSFSWTPVNAGVPQGSILGPLFFVIYMFLSKGISSTVKIFADDTSIFSIVDDVNVSVMQLNDDLLKCSIQKHLGIHLDEKLNFNHHVKEKITKANKGIGVIKKLSNTLPRDTLLSIYKSFVRPHLDYGDIIYDQPQNESFCNKLESIQYNAALAITGIIRGTSKTKLYKELRLEFLKSRRWFRRFCTFYKIITYNIPLYLADLLPKGTHS